MTAHCLSKPITPRRSNALFPFKFLFQDNLQSRQAKTNPVSQENKNIPINVIANRIPIATMRLFVEGYLLPIFHGIQVPLNTYRMETALFNHPFNLSFVYA